MMSTERSGTRLTNAGAFLAAAGLCGLVALAAPAGASGGPFDDLDGIWGGSGTVTYASGTKERLRCRVQYVVGSGRQSVTQALRCASDSYNFQINAIYVHNNGKISGTWDERSLEVSGSLTGTLSGGVIAGNLHGPGFLADYEVNTNGNAQTVRIAAEGQEIREVAVEVRKAPR